MQQHSNATWRMIEDWKWNRFLVTLPLLLVPFAVSGAGAGAWFAFEDRTVLSLVLGLVIAVIVIETTRACVMTIYAAWREWHQYHEDVRADPPSLEARLRIQEAIKDYLLNR